jgi:hypothetical protein
MQKENVPVISVAGASGEKRAGASR